MKCSEICALLEREYGTEYACDWDNVGLLAGRRDKEVKRILLALDANDEAVARAAEGGYDMLITHHPMIFMPLRSVTDADMNGRRLLKLIRHDISYYAMHTNYDTRGMADLAAKMLGLTECAVLEEVKDGEGIGRVGHLPRSMTLRECAQHVKAVFGIPSVRLYGDPERELSLVAICPGSGKSTMKEVLKFHCDVYITGDIDHHTGLDAVDQGLCIVDAGHYGVEHIFMEDVRAYLEKVLTGVHMDCMPVHHPFEVV